MGINKSALQGLVFAADNGVDFTNTVTIGRQRILIPHSQFSQLQQAMHLYNPKSKLPALDAEFSEDIFAFLGAKTVDAIDYSDFECASILHDMNNPIDKALHNKYTCVFDGGCLEHVFNYPVAVKNCMDMVRLGGHFISHTPSNNFFGHGFYQFSPELFFSLLSEENGFTDTKAFMQDDKGLWYKITAPASINQRVNICCSKKKPALIFVISRKIGHVPDVLSVQQSDYVERWAESTNFTQNKGKRGNNFAFMMYKLFSSPLRTKIRESKLGKRLKTLRRYNLFYTFVKNFPNIIDRQ